MKEILHKFKFKNLDLIVINSPKQLVAELTLLGFKTRFFEKCKSINTLVFINNKAEFVQFLTTQLANIEPDSVLWFAYPKGTSKIKTDINRDTIRLTAEEFDITTVSAITINDTWSALRFRPINRVGK